jgi:hypothetical protein
MTIDLLEPVTSNPYGAGSPFKSDSTNNPFSNQSATNPFPADAPRLLVRLLGQFGLSGPSGLSGSFSFFGLFGSFGYVLL